MQSKSGTCGPSIPSTRTVLSCRLRYDPLLYLHGGDARRYYACVSEANCRVTHLFMTADLFRGGRRDACRWGRMPRSLSALVDQVGAWRRLDLVRPRTETICSTSKPTPSTKATAPDDPLRSMIDRLLARLGLTRGQAWRRSKMSSHAKQR